jgi:hypothetical protein
MNIECANNYYPTKITCSRTAIASQWMRKYSIWRLEFWDAFTLEVNTWDNGISPTLYVEGDYNVSMMTNYHIFLEQQDVYHVYRLRDGGLVQTPCAKHIGNVLNIPNKYHAYIDKCTSFFWPGQDTPFQFLGANITQDTYEWVEYHTYSYPTRYSGTGTGKREETHRGGIIRVSFN